MRENVRLSIIVPVYNVEEFLPRCLDSIVAQTFVDFECILVDDGSPDESGKICDDFALRDSRFCVIHQENAGVGSARNAGLAVARGGWITFVDPDDWIEPDLYKNAFSAVAEKDADFVYWNCISFGDGQNEEILPINAGDIVVEKLYYLHGVVWRAIYKKTLLSENGISFAENIPFSEDMPFVYKSLAVAKKPYCIGICGYHYFIRNNSATRIIQSKERIHFVLKMIADVEEFIEKHDRTAQFSSVLEWRISISKTQLLYVAGSQKDFLFFRNFYPNVVPIGMGCGNSILYFLISHKIDWSAKLLCLLRRIFRYIKYRKLHI